MKFILSLEDFSPFILGLDQLAVLVLTSHHKVYLVIRAFSLTCVSPTEPTRCYLAHPQPYVHTVTDMVSSLALTFRMYPPLSSCINSTPLPLRCLKSSSTKLFPRPSVHKILYEIVAFVLSLVLHYTVGYLL